MSRWQTVLNCASQGLWRRGAAELVLVQRGGTTVLRLTTRLLRLGMTLILFAGSSVCWAVDGTEPGGPETSTPPSPPAQESEPAADRPAADETPEQARRRELTAQHGAKAADAILAGNVVKEMTMEQVQLARGAPARKEVIPPDAELWHYAAGEVAFSGGKVSYVSLAAKTESPPARRRDEGGTERAEIRNHAVAEPPEQVVSPTITVGDSYVYESKDPTDPKSGIRTRRTVTATKGKVILSSLNLNNKRAKARSIYFDCEWNLIATRSPDSSGRDFTPPLKYYDFPLFPGKKWQQTTTETNIKTGAIRTHTVSGTVEHWETVSVPAGTFRAIRVHLLTEVFDPSTGERISGTDTSWYVPEVRRSVKSQTTGRGGRERLIQLLRYELVPDVRGDGRD